MAIFEPTSVSGDSSKPDTGRRSFVWKTGAAMSAVIASAVTGISKQKVGPDAGSKDQLDYLSNRIGSLEDANAIRRLHQAYESRLDRGMYEEVAGMFTDDAEIVYSGGVFTGKAGIRRLYCDHFASGRTGRKIEPAPGFETDPAQQLDIVEVAGDRKTATGQFPYSIQVGAPMSGDSSLVEMARLQGEGIVHWWESGITEVSYVKKDNTWKIGKLEHRVNLKADYKPGRSYAKPIDVAAFSSIFPKNPTGPDRLV
jgi:SnoaL-like protein